MFPIALALGQGVNIDLDQILLPESDSSNQSAPSSGLLVLISELMLLFP